MGRKKKKNNDLQKTGIISLLVIIGALGYINLINGNISLPEAKFEPNINITSTPFYQKIFGAKNQSRVKENILTDSLADPIQAVTQPQNEVKIFFLSHSNNKDVYMPVYRSNNTAESNLEFAISCLLSGPSTTEKNKGAYSEIPPARLLSVKETPDKVLVDITSSFGHGGGADSVYKRMFQLIKTVNYNTNKPVYLLLDGRMVEVLGGEGLIIKQPLNGSSLDE